MKMSCETGSPCCPPPCCPPACCPPIVIKTRNRQEKGQCCVFQLPPVNIVCEIPAPPKNKNPPKVCCIPLVMCEDEDGGASGGGCCGGGCGSGGAGGGCCSGGGDPMPFIPSCGQPASCSKPPICCVPINIGCPTRGGAIRGLDKRF